MRFADTVETDKLRVVFPKGSYVGASEFEAYAFDPVSVDDVNRLVKTGTKASDLKLPSTVSASYSDGSRRDLAVTWGKVSDDQLANDGEFTVTGRVTGALTGAKANIGVRSDASSQNSGTPQALEQTVYQNSVSVELPTTVPVRFPNGMLDDRKVTWNKDDIAKIDLKTIGDYEVSGTAEASNSQAKITVHVVSDPNAPTPSPEPEEGWIEGSAAKTTVSAEASWSKAEGKLNDGVVVDESDKWPAEDDKDVNAYVWGSWGQAKDGMYAQYDWDTDQTIDSSRVQYWANFSERDDSKGGLDVPDSWKIQYLAEDGTWKDVENAKYTTVRNSPASRATDKAKGWSTATFTPVKTKSLRLVMNPPTGEETFGVAVAEWGVHATEDAPEPAPVDKTALETALKAAGSLDESKFTAASWKAFQQVVAEAQAVYDNADATQEEADAAVTKLEEAQKALVNKADKTALGTAIAEAEKVDADKYTDETVKALDKALKAAKGVDADDNATQSEVDVASKALNEAIKGLKAKSETPPTPMPSVDKSQLKAAVDAADALKQGSASDAAWKSFTKALAKAKSVLNDDAATQQDVDSALKALQDSQKNMGVTPAPVTPSGNGSSDASDAAISSTGSAIIGVFAAAAVVLILGVSFLLISHNRCDEC